MKDLPKLMYGEIRGKRHRKGEKNEGKVKIIEMVPMARLMDERMEERRKIRWKS